MADQEKTCPIWGTPATCESFPNAGGVGPHWVRGFNVNSLRAGGCYAIEKQAYDAVKNPDFYDGAKARLTTWLIEQHLAGIENPPIDTNVIADVKKRHPLSVVERGDRLLKHIQSRVTAIGDTIKIPASGPDDAMLAWSESCKMSEVIYLLDYLVKSGFVEQPPYTYGDFVASGGGFGDPQFSNLKPNDQLPPSLASFREYAISPGGHAHLASRAADATQAFVAMWFDDSMSEAYDKGIQRAIVDAGYRPIRIDRKDHNNRIDDEIIAEIRRSRFLVADFTQGAAGARGGVYYEAGLAHGLNIPVIFTCRIDVIDKVHFDTRQYNHITWANSAELRKRLAKRISATIGDGPLRKAV